jgi:predicted solute-binding protein
MTRNHSLVQSRHTKRITNRAMSSISGCYTIVEHIMKTETMPQDRQTNYYTMLDYQVDLDDEV